MTVPRIPRTSHPEGDPLPPHIEVVLILACTAGTIGMLWGAWELWRWFIRFLLSH